MDKTNYHTHTKRCKHAIGEDREYIECAIKNGFKVLGFSDHCPFIYNGYTSFMRMNPEDVEGYFYSLTNLKAEYKGSLRNVGVVKSICKQVQTAAYQCSNHGISATGGFISHGYSFSGTEYLLSIDLRMCPMQSI